MIRRALPLAILIYVALDFALPGMPGAFVLEAGDSVDGTRASRARLTTEVVVLPELRGGPFVFPSPRLIDHQQRMPAARDVVTLGRPAVRCLPRAACPPSPPSSEDPY